MKSLSEIETTSKRASKAAGFSWGVAEEIGKCIRLLELFGLPGIKNLKDLEEAINLNCNIIKIYPIKSKASSIDILNFESIDFIAAGGLSINDVKTYQSLGYKAIVIGDKGIIKKKFDPKIYEWLKNN